MSIVVVIVVVVAVVVVVVMVVFERTNPTQAEETHTHTRNPLINNVIGPGFFDKGLAKTRPITETILLTNFRSFFRFRSFFLSFLSFFFICLPLFLSSPSLHS